MITAAALAAAVSLALCAPFLVLCRGPEGHLATELTLGGCSLSDLSCCGGEGIGSPVPHQGEARDAQMGPGPGPPECTDSALTQASFEDSPRFDACQGASPWGIEPGLQSSGTARPSPFANETCCSPPGLTHVKTTILLI